MCLCVYGCGYKFPIIPSMSGAVVAAVPHRALKPTEAAVTRYKIKSALNAGAVVSLVYL